MAPRRKQCDKCIFILLVPLPHLTLTLGDEIHSIDLHRTLRDDFFLWFEEIMIHVMNYVLMDFGHLVEQVIELYNHNVYCVGYFFFQRWWKLIQKVIKFLFMVQSSLSINQVIIDTLLQLSTQFHIFHCSISLVQCLLESCSFSIKRSHEHCHLSKHDCC